MMQKREAPRRRLSRFQTQPVTPDEVETAKCITPPHVALLGVFLLFSSVLLVPAVLFHVREWGIDAAMLELGVIACLGGVG